jgi:hypothetical protein
MTSHLLESKSLALVGFGGKTPQILYFQKWKTSQEVLIRCMKMCKMPQNSGGTK